MSDPTPIAEARELIRAGRFDAAVERLVAALPGHGSQPEVQELMTSLAVTVGPPSETFSPAK